MKSYRIESNSIKDSNNKKMFDECQRRKSVHLGLSQINNKKIKNCYETMTTYELTDRQMRPKHENYNQSEIMYNPIRSKIQKYSINQEKKQNIFDLKKQLKIQSQKQQKIFGMLENVDQKIKKLQEDALYKKQKIFQIIKTKIIKLLQKYGYQNQDYILSINNQITMIQLLVKVFTQKDQELREIWIQKQKKLTQLQQNLFISEQQKIRNSSYVQSIISSQKMMEKSLNQKIEQYENLHIKYISLLEQYNQIKNSPHKNESQFKNNKIVTKQYQLSSKINEYQKQMYLILQQNSNLKSSNQKYFQEITQKNAIIQQITFLNKNLEESLQKYKEQITKIKSQNEIQKQKQLSLKQIQKYRQNKQNYQNMNYNSKYTSQLKIANFLDFHIQSLEKQLKNKGVPPERLNQQFQFKI